MTRARLALLPLLVFAVAVVACDSKKPKPAAPAVAPIPDGPAPKQYVPLSAAQKAQVKLDFEEAEAIAAEAAKWKSEGDALVASEGMQAAIPKYQEAMPLYLEAMQMVEHWIEPDLEEVTADQVEQELRPYVNTVHKWQQAKASMGKVPPKSR